ncbi:hypothetical protein DUI87_03242 [Hirundo rustica rustica]|uniref:ribonuclease H n=1 Tax=Hirundo rustica rustica TaxID=333673 RepID=A0A3M0L2B4_HIRRU|nr:hypothetical protein DUI87_03242 [Hirundo rustica rustica]
MFQEAEEREHKPGRNRGISSFGPRKDIGPEPIGSGVEIWERIAKGYRSDPIGVAKKMKFMIKQHSPDWADLQLLLDALTETEKQLVLKVAGDLAEDDCRTTQEDVKDVFPLQDPDLKDAFFCLPLHEASQKMFAFKWESPKTGRKTQLTWCVLLQGYKNSPTIFGEQLAKDLESWEPPPGEGQLLQYVDDLLIASRTQKTCVDWTVSLLNFLGLQGYRVSQKKVQMVRQTVINLGYEVSAGQRTLGQDRKEAICQTPKPQTVKELRTLLGMTGWCRL